MITKGGTMNKTILIGRLTKDAEIRQGNDKTIARFTLAVDRRFKQEGGQAADFISCVAFGKTAEFIEKYVYKGMKVALEGRIQTGKYDKDGVTHYTTDVIVENIEFAESKKATENDAGFLEVDDTLNDDGLPF